MTQMNEQVMADRAATLQVSRDEMVERVRKSIPLGRWGEPEDIANMVAFLASPESTGGGGIPGGLGASDGESFGTTGPARALEPGANSSGGVNGEIRSWNRRELVCRRAGAGWQRCHSSKDPMRVTRGWPRTCV